jgi:hypothetical protein
MLEPLTQLRLVLVETEALGMPRIQTQQALETTPFFQPLHLRVVVGAVVVMAEAEEQAVLAGVRVQPTLLVQPVQELQTKVLVEALQPLMYLTLQTAEAVAGVVRVQ